MKLRESDIQNQCSIIQSAMEYFMPKFKTLKELNESELDLFQRKIACYLETDIRFPVIVQQSSQSQLYIAIRILKHYYEQANLDFKTLHTLLKKIKHYQLLEDIILPLKQLKYALQQQQNCLSYEQVFPLLKFKFSYQSFIQYIKERINDQGPTYLINNNPQYWKKVLMFMDECQKMENQKKKSTQKLQKTVNHTLKSEQKKQSQVQAEASRKTYTQSAFSQVYNRKQEKTSQAKQNSNKRLIKVNTKTNAKYMIKMIIIQSLDNGQESQQVQSVYQCFAGEEITFAFLSNEEELRKERNRTYVVG